MDYATSPVSVTPGPQPTASSERQISASEATGFHGLLQSASTDSATGKPAQDKKSAQRENQGVSVAHSASQPGSDSKDTVVPAKIAVAYTENSESALRFTATSPALQQDAHAMAMAIELGADVQAVAAAESTGNDKITAELPAAMAAVLSQSQHGATGPQVNAAAQIASHGQPVTDGVSIPVESSLLQAESGNSKFGTGPAASVAVSGVRNASVQSGAETDAVNGDVVVTLPSRGLDLSKPVSLAPMSVSAQSGDSSVVNGTAQNTSESLMIAGRVGSAPLQHGQPAATDSQAADQPLLSRALPVVSNAALPVDGKMSGQPASASAELASTHAASVSVSATTVTTARELMARQRSAATAADETVSQISRGGTEARILEVNGARGTGAATSNPITSTPVESKAGPSTNITNAVALAATREEKVLRVATDAMTQQQPVAKIGGVDVSQIGSVDFAAARLDSAAVPQTAPKLAILEPGWTSQLGTDLRALVARGPASTQLQVTPAELGPLDIEVSINRQEVSVRILAMHGQTREMLEAALPRLRDTLGQSYTSVDVSVGSGSGNSTSGGQHHNSQAGTLGMMTGNQDGPADTGSDRNNAGAEASDGEQAVNDLSMNELDELMDENPVAAKPSVARGLVDAYA